MNEKTKYTPGHRFGAVLLAVLVALFCGGVSGLVAAPNAKAEEAMVPQSPGGSSGKPEVMAVDATAGVVGSAAKSHNSTPKEEVVYARLAQTGAVNNIYVVNVLNPKSPGTVTDYGDYSAVMNLTDANTLNQTGDAVEVDVSGASLSYQGDMVKKELPWIISLTYKLDGKIIAPDELGGKSGNLEVSIATKQNAAIEPLYFENYLLQITLVFASDKASQVATPEGQIALAGSNTQVTFTGMPGKAGAFTATAAVTDFEMAGMSFAAIPFSMVIESPDKAGLLSGFKQLADGVDILKSGASSLAGGASGISTGASDLASGISGVAGGASDLALGARGVASGADSVSGGLQAYQGGLNKEAANAAASVISTAPQEQAYAAAMQVYASAFAMAYHAANPDVIGVEAAMNAAAQATVSQSAAVQTALTNLVTANATNGGFMATSQALTAAASGLGSPSDAVSLLGGTASVASGALALAAGADSLAGGASQAASGASSLSSGAGTLAGGAQELATGTDTLYTEIQAMPDTVAKEIDKMISEYDKSGFIPKSFTSSKNVEVTLVQFVLATDPIVAPVPETEAVATDEGNFWTRLLALFGIAS